MKIEKVELNLVSMPLVARLETSFGGSDDRECILIRIYSEGLVGLGECVADRDPGYGYETTGTAWHIFKDFIIPEVLGKNISTPDDFQRMVSGIRGHLMAKAGFEMAIWDLIGKMQKKSLRLLFQGERQKVDVGVSVGIQNSSQTLVKVVGEYLDQGYGRIKLKIKPGRDVQDVRAVREAYPEIRLQVDANSAYTLETAQSLLVLDDFDLLLIEQPLFDDDIWEHHKLQKQFRTAICLDESIISERHTRYAIEMEACRIINIKAGRVGGLSEAVAIHNTCEKSGLPNWCGGMLETGVGRASNLALASLPNFILPADISATNRYYVQDITNESFVLNPDSTIDVPDGDGLGVTINEKALKAFSLSSASYGK
jgi:O-succinylbenzoate synthase